jgi:SAM-dependent methyltransferase
MYNDEFYKKRQDFAIQSAREIVPLIIDLFNPTSVIDVGCANGTWLSVFKELGVEDIIGIDGKWVDQDLLLIPSQNFLVHNLEEPLHLTRKFDLVTSIEVAEHLSPERANSFIEELTKLAPIIVFSAAIPEQGGTGHINEQWPEYWAKKFKDNNYLVFDYLRPKIWNNDKVNVVHAQNILIFVNENHITKIKELKDYNSYIDVTNLSYVHPRYYLHAINRKKNKSKFSYIIKKLHNLRGH